MWPRGSGRKRKIGNSAVSVSSVAVDLAKKIFESLERKTVLLIGAGEMCELAAQHLVSGGIEKVLVTNRTYERAVALAQQFKGEAIPFDEMNVGLRRADIVISATDSPQYLIRHDQVAKVHEGQETETDLLHRYRRPPGHRTRRSMTLRMPTFTTSMTFKR